MPEAPKLRDFRRGHVMRLALCIAVQAIDATDVVQGWVRLRVR